MKNSEPTVNTLGADQRSITRPFNFARLLKEPKVTKPLVTAGQSATSGGPVTGV